MIQVFENKIINENSINSNILNEVASDWVEQPIVDALVYTPPLYEPLVTSLINGIDEDGGNSLANSVNFDGVG